MDLIATAKAALAQYGMLSAEPTLLRHNENAVFQFTHDAHEYILRLHTPKEGLHTSHVAEPAWIESEMRFISALADGGVRVQQPVASQDGSLVVRTAEGIAATVLSWLPGIPLTATMQGIPSLANAVGMLFASLHAFVLGHPQTSKWPRPAYDGQRIEAALDTIGAGVSDGLLTAGMYAQVCACGKEMAEVFSTENTKRGMHGLIHADPGLGNLIVEGNNVSPIDFSLCGHGPFAFDLGGLMGTFDDPHLRRAALDGYAKCRAMPEHRAIEAGFLAGILFFMAMHLHNPHVREWFGRRLPLVIGEYMSPFLSGRPVLPSLLGMD